MILIWREFAKLRTDTCRTGAYLSQAMDNYVPYDYVSYIDSSKLCNNLQIEIFTGIIALLPVYFCFEYSFLNEPGSVLTLLEDD